MNRRLGLGIDTGGTYTDAAIVDLDSHAVLSSAKAPTTHHDLSIGLYEAVGEVMSTSGLGGEALSMVGISTTLATNSILEDRGGEVGLILIGWEPKGGIDMGESVRARVQGEVDFNGRITRSLDLSEVDDAIDLMDDMDAIAVSGIFSVLNDSMENAVRRRVMERVSKPVVTGHDLTTALGIDLRTETAVLNGRLIPIIDRFFDGVESTFGRMGIDAPIMVYKGDGSLMHIDIARVRPVETILSGPAASAMGGCILAGMDDCIIVDIGGTSTDIGFLDDSFPRIQKEGATVGRWRTRVRAVDMWTYAFGGDSRVSFGPEGLMFGPDRVVPLAIASVGHPGIVDMLHDGRTLDLHMAHPGTDPGNGNAARIHRFLIENGPQTVASIRSGLEGVWMVDEYLTDLRRRGSVVGVGLTPTDLLHCTGEHVSGDPEASRAGLRVIAHRMGVDPEDAMTMIRETMESVIAKEVLRKLVLDETGEVPEGRSVDQVLGMAVDDARHVVGLDVTLDRPIVCVGGPSQYLMPALGRRLGAEIIIPEDHIVGNAVGAVCSKITEVVSVQVQPGYHSNYMVKLPLVGMQEYEQLSSALAAAARSASKYVTDRVRAAGGTDITVETWQDEFRAVEGPIQDDVEQLNFVDVHARAVGEPDLDSLLRGATMERDADRGPLLGAESIGRL